jgi:hypothetical protein
MDKANRNQPCHGIEFLKQEDKTYWQGMKQEEQREIRHLPTKSTVSA